MSVGHQVGSDPRRSVVTKRKLPVGSGQEMRIPFVLSQRQVAGETENARQQRIPEVSVLQLAHPYRSVGNPSTNSADSTNQNVSRDKFVTLTAQMWRTDGTTLQRSESLAGADLPCCTGTQERPKFWNLWLPSGLSGRAVGFAFEPVPVNASPRHPAAVGTLRSRPDHASPSSTPTIKPSLPGKEVILVVAVVRHELDEALACLALVLSGCGLLVLGLPFWWLSNRMKP